MDPAVPRVQMRGKFGVVASFQGIHNFDTVTEHPQRTEGGGE